MFKPTLIVTPATIKGVAFNQGNTVIGYLYTVANVYNTLYTSAESTLYKQKALLVNMVILYKICEI